MGEYLPDWIMNTLAIFVGLFFSSMVGFGTLFTQIIYLNDPVGESLAFSFIFSSLMGILFFLQHFQNESFKSKIEKLEEN